MGLFNKKIEEKAIVDFNYSPSISSDVNLTRTLSEQFKGEVEKKDVKFPRELGEEHPFNFKDLEELYRRFGFFTAVVDKYVDFTIGPGFYVECEDERALKIIEDFIRDTNLDTILRAWCKEGLVKGNGFLEIGGSKKEGVKGLKVLNANYMYVKRDKYGKILGYNQYKGAFDKFSKDKIVAFEESQIAHFPYNSVGDCAYGQGIGYSALRNIDNILSMEKDEHWIIKRKANAPLHAKLGKVDGTTKIIPKPEDVAAFGQKMETMSNKTDWATDALVELSVVDFGNIGEKFAAVLEYDRDMLFYIFQVPAVLMGMANIAEGLADVQMDAFERRIQSIQAELEKIIEGKIFKRVLEANGLTDIHVEFQWGRPSNSEKAERLTKIKEFMTNMRLSDTLFNMMEKDVVKLLDYNQEEYESNVEDEEIEKQKELERQQPLVPGQNANPPQFPPKEKTPQPKPVPVPKPEEMIKPIVDTLKEAEEKRLEILLNQIKSLSENDEKRTDTYNQSLTKLIELMLKQQELKEETKKEVIKQEIDQKIEQAPKQNKLKNRIRRTRVIPTYGTSKESTEPEVTETTKVIEIKKEDKTEESFDSINDIEEWLGFSYKKFLGYIQQAVANYDFEQIKALTEAEHEAGYLTDLQVEKVRNILDEGFKKGSSISEMTKEVDKLGLKDLYRMTDDGALKKGASGLPILAKSAEKRSEGIVRSEVTRLANIGAENYYKDNGIDKVSWVASIGARTCPECEALNGQIFKIGEHPSIPLHTNCRCTLAPFVELK